MPKKSDKSPLRIPKEARKAYNDTLGRLLAQEKVNEQKAAQYGRLHTVDRHNSTSRLPNSKSGGFKLTDREGVYRKAIQLYDQNEIVRPIINLIASSIFSSGQPDIKGEREDLVELAQNIITENDINFHDIAREGEMAGDVFLAFDKADGAKTRVVSLDAGITCPLLKDNDIRQIQGYEIKESGKVDVPLSRCQHLKFNSTTTSLTGRSSLRHVIYWCDVMDFLFEAKWLRGADNYGQPLLAITGVPSQFHTAFKASLEAEVQRAGKTWVLPPETNVLTPSMALDYPIGDIVSWTFRMISVATELPITLLGSADATSRGSAFFANPRWILAIKPRREVWRIGLRRFFLKIFLEEGLIKEDEVITRRDFDIGFLPIFEKDLTDIADVVAIYRASGLISKETAQEWVGIDASDEKEKLKMEERENPPQDASLFGDEPQDPLKQLQLKSRVKKMVKQGGAEE